MEQELKQIQELITDCIKNKLPNNRISDVTKNLREIYQITEALMPKPKPEVKPKVFNKPEVIEEDDETE